METDNKIAPVYMASDEWGELYSVNELSSDIKKSWEGGIIDIFMVEVVDGKIIIKTLYWNVEEDKAAWREVDGY